MSYANENENEREKKGEFISQSFLIVPCRVVLTS